MTYHLEPVPSSVLRSSPSTYHTHSLSLPSLLLISSTHTKHFHLPTRLHTAHRLRFDPHNSRLEDAQQAYATLSCGLLLDGPTGLAVLVPSISPDLIIVRYPTPPPSTAATTPSSSSPPTLVFSPFGRNDSGDETISSLASAGPVTSLATCCSSRILCVGFGHSGTVAIVRIYGGAGEVDPSAPVVMLQQQQQQQLDPLASIRLVLIGVWDSSPTLSRSSFSLPTTMGFEHHQQQQQQELGMEMQMCCIENTVGAGAGGASLVVACRCTRGRDSRQMPICVSLLESLVGRFRVGSGDGAGTDADAGGDDVSSSLFFVERAPRISVVAPVVRTIWRGGGGAESSSDFPERSRVLCIANTKGTIQLIDVVSSSSSSLSISETLYIDRGGRSEVNITHCCLFANIRSRHDVLVVVIQEEKQKELQQEEEASSSSSSTIRFIDVWSRARLREFPMPSVIVSCEIVRGLLKNADGDEDREYLVAGDEEGHLHAWATDEVLLDRGVDDGMSGGSGGEGEEVRESVDSDDESLPRSRGDIPSPISLRGSEEEEEEEEGEVGKMTKKKNGAASATSAAVGGGGSASDDREEVLCSVELPRSAVPRPSPKEAIAHSIELPRSRPPQPSPQDTDSDVSSRMKRERSPPKKNVHVALTSKGAKVVVTRHQYTKKVPIPKKPTVSEPKEVRVPSPKRVPEFVEKQPGNGTEEDVRVNANFGNPATFNAVLHQEALRLQEEQEGEVVAPPHRFAQRRTDPEELRRKIEEIERMSFDEESALEQYREAEKTRVTKQRPAGRFRSPDHHFQDLQSVEVDKSAFVIKSKRAKRVTSKHLARELSAKPRLDEFFSREDFEEEIGYDPFSARARARRPGARKVYRLTPKRPDPAWEMAFAKQYM